MATEKTVRVEGLRELERAFKVADSSLARGLREAMEASAEVVRFPAETLAAQTIRRSNIDWTRMRVGVTRRTAYVAPVERGKFSKSRGGRARYGRPNLKRRLLDHALEPALDQNASRAEQEFVDALNDLARAWSRA